MKEYKYSLLNKKTNKRVRYYVQNNHPDADFCNDSTYTFSENGELEWFVDSAFLAARARIHSEDWYNSSYEFPNHYSNWKPEDWDVVQIEIQNNIIYPKTPTLEDFNEYAKKNKLGIEYKSLEGVDSHMFLKVCKEMEEK